MEVSGLVRKQRHKNLCQMEIYFHFHLHIRSDVLLVLARAFKCPEPPNVAATFGGCQSPN